MHFQKKTYFILVLDESILYELVKRGEYHLFYLINQPYIYEVIFYISALSFAVAKKRGGLDRFGKIYLDV